MTNKILVVDDEPNVCWAFQQFLEDDGHSVKTASNAEDGIELAGSFKPDLVILDVLLPGMDGLTAIPKFQAKCEAPIIVITAHGTVSTAIEAIQRGAYDYLTKPVDIHKTRVVISRALETQKLHEEVSKLRKQIQAGTGIEEILVGRSSSMQDVYKKIGSISASDVPVLIRGESGSGKELSARVIHLNSRRKDGPFVPINCGSLPESILESELFGHEKGAFTGAVAAKPGKVEKANGGTLFLDEIGDISQQMQVSLLRFLEEKTFERVGGTQTHEVDLRVLAATNQNLEDLIQKGDFREDLYYRLNVITLTMPPLRERFSDLPLLIAHFINQSEYPETEISAEAVKQLEKYQWPGNLRELRNTIEHAVVLSRGGVVLPEHLPTYIVSPSLAHSEAEKDIEKYIFKLVEEGPARFGPEVYEGVMSIWEKPLIQFVMRQTKGNQVKASEFLGIHRTTLRNKLKKYGIE